MIFNAADEDASVCNYPVMEMTLRVEQGSGVFLGYPVLCDM